eukprot:SAG31_NODE_1417_length_8440_cov_7.706510_5_plen_87_part_00
MLHGTARGTWYLGTRADRQRGRIVRIQPSVFAYRLSSQADICRSTARVHARHEHSSARVRGCSYAGQPQAGLLLMAGTYWGRAIPG